MLRKLLEWNLTHRSWNRVFHEADGAGGSGADPAPTDAPAANDPAPTDGAKVDPANPAGNGKPTDPKPNEGAAERYEISQRKRAEKAEKELQDFITRSKEPVPQFDETNDPDGSKEIQHSIDKGIQEGLKKALQGLGLEDTLSQIHFERDRENFFKVVNSAMPAFEALGVPVPEKSAMLETLKSLENGITPDQLIILTQNAHILDRLRNPGFSPGSGGQSTAKTALTQDEINANIYKSAGVFGH